MLTGKAAAARPATAADALLRCCVLTYAIGAITLGLLCYSRLLLLLALLRLLLPLLGHFAPTDWHIARMSMQEHIVCVY
jgi:hypothetical protein